MLKHLNVKILSTEVSAVATLITDAFNEATALSTDATLASIVNTISTTNIELTEAILRTKVLSKMEEADGIRDDKVRSIYHFIYANRMLKDEAVRKAAEELETVFDKYGQKINDMNYLAESGLIESLLTDFDSAAMKANIAKLAGLPTAVSELREAEDAFRLVQKEYENARIDLSAKAKSYELKKVMVGLINTQLVQYLEVMLKTVGNAYANFYKAVGDIIVNANATVHRRATKPNGEPAETDSTATQE